MQHELIDEASFKKIVSNQSLIIQDLDKSYTTMHSFLQLSNKYLPEAVNSFKIGQQHISKIRSNLDYIHKVMLRIKKKIKAQKQQQKIKQQQVNTVAEAMKNIMEQQVKDNFLQTTEQLLEDNNNQKQYKELNDNLSNSLQVDQIQKLMAYYKLDETDNQNRQNTQQNKQFLQQINKVKPVNQLGPFVLLSKQQSNQKEYEQYKYDEPLI